MMMRIRSVQMLRSIVRTCQFLRKTFSQKQMVTSRGHKLAIKKIMMLNATAKRYLQLQNNYNYYTLYILSAIASISIYHIQQLLLQKLSVGALVLLRNSARDSRKGDKLAKRWFGPYRIHKHVGKGVYQLENLSSGRVLKKTYNTFRYATLSFMVAIV